MIKKEKEPKDAAWHFFRQIALVLGLITIGFLYGCSSSTRLNFKRPVVIVYQPSHQTDTGENFSEATVCDGIVEAARQAHTGKFQIHKVWSYNVSGLRYARQGSNTKIEHTSRIVDDSLTGYAWELRESNNLKPTVFIAVHNNGGTNRHAIWGFIHEGDVYEEQNRELASLLIGSISEATGLENRGVHVDGSVGRNDYRCSTSGKRAFFSIDENINIAPYRVLLEIGDNAVSRDFLMNPAHQELIGKNIAGVLEKRFGAP